MAGSDGDGRRLRPEIAQSWRRAQLCGLDPGSVPTEPDLASVDEESPLLAAARPVLDDLEVQLADTRFSVLLADRDARIVQRRCASGELAAALDGVLAMPGSRYSEETTGTNALASAYEVGSGISVHGEEHFLEKLKVFTCRGQRIRDPFTGALEGVLDVTGYARDHNPLLSTVVAWAAREIEHRLVHGAGYRQRAMLRAYQARARPAQHTHRARRGERPLIVFGDDLLLLNAAASALLDGPTQIRLRELAEHAGARGGGSGILRLPSGAEVSFRCDPVDGAPGAALVELMDLGPQTPVIPRRPVGGDPMAPLLSRIRRDRDRALVTGEPGTGRTRTAHAVAGDAAVRVLDHDHVRAHSTATLTSALEAHDGLTVIEHLHLLGPEESVRLRGALDAAPTSWVAVTSAPLEHLDPEQRSAAARCTATVELLPLRHRRNEVPRLARDILRELDPRHPCVLTPAAEAALTRHDWPGNLPELVSLLGRAARRRPGSDLLAGDLDLAQQGGSGSGRARSLLEESEAQTIRAALRRCEGNKTRAAEQLGISRTTLWRRIHELELE